jgi:hypothetical protein
MSADICAMSQLCARAARKEWVAEFRLTARAVMHDAGTMRRQKGAHFF